MSAETTTRSLAQEIGDLLRCHPAHDGPEDVKTAWGDRKRELLAAVEVVEAEYTAQHTPESTTRMETTMPTTDSAVLPLSAPCPSWCAEPEHGAHRFDVGDDVFNDVRMHTDVTRARDGRWTVSTGVTDALACGGMVRGQASINLDIDADQELSAATAREMAAALVKAADMIDGVAA
jgi:hypothetical protein